MPRYLSRAVAEEIQKSSLIILETLEIASNPPYTAFDMFFVNNVRPIVIGSQLYSAMWFQRGDSRSSTSTAVDRTSVSVDNADRFWSRFIANRSITGMRARLKKVLPEVVTSIDECPTLFDGYFGSPTFTEQALSVEIRAPFVARTTELPNRSYSPNCGVTFGSGQCGVPVNVPQHSRTFVADTGSTKGRIVNQSAFYDLPNNHFAVGYAIMLSGPSAGSVRPIFDSNHTTIRLLVPFPTDPTGYSVKIVRGCRKTKVDCDRNDNLPNYKGFAEVPLTPSVDTASTVVSSGGGGGGK